LNLGRDALVEKKPRGERQTFKTRREKKSYSSVREEVRGSKYLEISRRREAQGGKEKKRLGKIK